MSDQIPLEDSLLDDPLDDILDRGFSPPERQPAEWSRGAVNGSRPGAVGAPPDPSGASSATAMPMSS